MRASRTSVAGGSSGPQKRNDGSRQNPAYRSPEFSIDFFRNSLNQLQAVSPGNSKTN